MSDIQHLQEKLDHIQSLYRQWLAAKEVLERSRNELKQALKIMGELEAAYYSPEYSDLLHADAQGLLDTKTPGEYSVMSEDTIFDELIDKDQALWATLRLCIDHLDRQ